MMKFCALFILLMGWCAWGSNSVPLNGRIVDHKGKPVKNVKVYTDDSNAFVKTDKSGKFELPNVESDGLLFMEYKGRTSSLTLKGESNVEIFYGEDGRIFDKSEYKGETFHGTIMNHKGKPVRGAIVYTSDPFDYVKSDRDGKFLLDNVVETDTVHISHDGYIHDIAMDGSKGMYIVIGRSSGRRVADDLVNMGAGKISAREYNGPMDVFNHQRLEATGESDLFKALLRCPGIGSRYEDGEQKISIRASNFNPLWVVDGVEMTSIPELTIMEVDRVQILKDGALFGTRGAGGVILVKTKGTPE